MLFSPKDFVGLAVLCGGLAVASNMSLVHNEANPPGSSHREASLLTSTTSPLSAETLFSKSFQSLLETPLKSLPPEALVENLQASNEAPLSEESPQPEAPSTRTRQAHKFSFFR